MAGPDDPPATRHPDRDGLHRRRSSVAYDPARDTFTEISEAAPDQAIDDKSGQKQDSSPGPPDSDPQRRTMNSPEDHRKRRRSGSAQAQDTDDLAQDAPSLKRQRSSAEEVNVRPQTSVNEDHQNGVRSVKDLPKISRIPRTNDDESRPRTQHNRNRSPVSAYSRRPDGAQPREREGNGTYNDRRRSRSPPPRRQDRGFDRDRDRERERERERERQRDVYRRRSPPRQQRRDPSRSPSPIRSPPRAGPIIRPGGARGRGRNVLAEQQRLAAEREARQAQQAGNQARGVQDVSNQFYNARPEWVRERGREWRRNESQIKGLRIFNNWVKSCLIQKFSPEDKAVGQEEELGWGEQPKEPEETKPLLVLDVGCGKGGDLGKWQLAPQIVGLYVGLDPASTSINQARERYTQMRRGRKPIFDARFVTQDCFGEWIGNVPIVQEVGIDPNAGSGQIQRWGGGGFDIVTMMFTMHYSFESEERVRMMLRNVAGSLKKGGRLIGVSPNSDVLAARIRDWYAKHPDQAPKPDKDGNLMPARTNEPKQDGDSDEVTPSWGNSIYKIRFPPQPDPNMVLSPDGTFRPPFGWKYLYWMAEAVDVPEFVIPWEALRAIAEQFGLEQRYRRGFLDIWESETRGNDPMARELSNLGMRMGVVRSDGGDLLMSEEEKEAVNFYHAFCFVKV